MKGFVQKLVEAKKRSSPYMKNSLEIFGKSLKSCAVGCAFSFFAPLAIVCGVCIANKHKSITNQQNKVSKILGEKKKQFEKFISYFNSSGEIAKQMGGRVVKQREALEHFKGTLQVMEAKIGSYINLLFIKTSKNRIYEAMKPLQEACEQLMKKLK